MSTVVTTMPGQETLIACWAALAQTSAGAKVIRATATTAAVFPSWAPLNNAILIGEDVGPAAAVVEELGSLYAEADVDVWALWVPSRATDLDAPDEVRDMAGLTRDTTTLIMRGAPDARPVPASWSRPSVSDLNRAHHRGRTGPGDRPRGAGHGTRPHGVGTGARRRGRESRMVLSPRPRLWDLCGRDSIAPAAPGLCAIARGAHPCGRARCRGARTASLQSTRMGQPLYESLGFEPVGRYEEWIST